MWCIPEVSAEYVAAMEDVLDLYEEPYDEKRPMVCFDESPKQLIAEVRERIPAVPGRPECFDVEYKRNGVRDLMMISEPKCGLRKVLVTERRTKIEFAQTMKHVVDMYPDADVIRVVLDNLNTHKAASLYEAFPPEQARAIARVADGVVVGSALVDLVARHGADAPRPIREYTAALAAAVHDARKEIA